MGICGNFTFFLKNKGKDSFDFVLTSCLLLTNMFMSFEQFYSVFSNFAKENNVGNENII